MIILAAVIVYNLDRSLANAEILSVSCPTGTQTGSEYDLYKLQLNVQPKVT